MSGNSLQHTRFEIKWRLSRTMPGNDVKSNDRTSLLLARVDELRAALRLVDPANLACRSGTQYHAGEAGKGEFRLHLWEQAISLSYPEFVAFNSHGTELNAALQALLVYYFSKTDGAPLAGKYIAFSELPEGKFYAQAFQSYTGEALRRFFGDDQSRFEQTARNLNGMPFPLGDASYAFPLLPRVSLLVVFWRGDEDFPSSYQVLFDAAAARHLPTDACAIAGSMLTHQIIAKGN
jgi:hypothetical protein